MVGNSSCTLKWFYTPLEKKKSTDKLISNNE